uniref:(California timema) hypothetical protein n=1 Tax=Timema californicum TaxID=61474 RepID=A0A7R9J003_TIMCA|nr:unnamed protein product [Timema californicum]
MSRLQHVDDLCNSNVETAFIIVEEEELRGEHCFPARKALFPSEESIVSQLGKHCFPARRELFPSEERIVSRDPFSNGFQETTTASYCPFGYVWTLAKNEVYKEAKMAVDTLVLIPIIVVKRGLVAGNTMSKANYVIPRCGFGGHWLMSRRRRRCVETRVGFAGAVGVVPPVESPVTRTSGWERWRSRRKESRQRESRRREESPGNVGRGGSLCELARVNELVRPITTRNHRAKYPPLLPGLVQWEKRELPIDALRAETLLYGGLVRASQTTVITSRLSEQGFGTSMAPTRVNDVFPKPLDKRIGGTGKSSVEGLRQTPEVVLSENMDCGADQTVERGWNSSPRLSALDDCSSRAPSSNNVTVCLRMRGTVAPELPPVIMLLCVLQENCSSRAPYSNNVTVCLRMSGTVAPELPPNERNCSSRASSNNAIVCLRMRGTVAPELPPNESNCSSRSPSSNNATVCYRMSGTLALELPPVIMLLCVLQDDCSSRAPSSNNVTVCLRMRGTVATELPPNEWNCSSRAPSSNNATVCYRISGTLAPELPPVIMLLCVLQDDCSSRVPSSNNATVCHRMRVTVAPELPSVIMSLCVLQDDCSSRLLLCTSGEKPANKKAVCGTDNQTYPSKCHLLHVQCQGLPVNIKHRGRCKVYFERDALDDVATEVVSESGSCSIPLSEVQPCWMDLRLRRDSSSAAEGGSRDLRFVPTCLEDGTYAPVQCHAETGFCWCVTQAGKPLPNTSVKFALPNCARRGKSSPRRRSSPRGHRQKKGKGKSKKCERINKAQFNTNLIKMFKTEYIQKVTTSIYGSLSQTMALLSQYELVHEAHSLERSLGPSPHYDPSLPLSLSKWTQEKPGQNLHNLFLPLTVFSDMQVDLERAVLNWKFSSLDLDGDDYLNSVEYKDLSRMVRKAVKPKKCSKVFTKLCDKDEDQRISRDEWAFCLGLDFNHRYVRASERVDVTSTVSSTPMATLRKRPVKWMTNNVKCSNLEMIEAVEDVYERTPVVYQADTNSRSPLWFSNVWRRSDGRKGGHRAYKRGKNMEESIAARSLIVASLPGMMVTKKLTKGCPRGLVCDPVFWDVALEPGFVEIESLPGTAGVIAFVDDILIIVGAETRRELKTESNAALAGFNSWCNMVKFSLALAKMTYVMFRNWMVKTSQGYQIPRFHCKLLQCITYCRSFLDAIAETVSKHERDKYVTKMKNRGRGRRDDEERNYRTGSDSGKRDKRNRLNNKCDRDN